MSTVCFSMALLRDCLTLVMIGFDDGGAWYYERNPRAMPLVFVVG